MTEQAIYETVVGLEVHAQLLTQSKLFCSDSTAYGADPNTHVSPVTLGHPGTLPKMNRRAVEFAVKMGLACHSEIARDNWFARKNYFYPDLPKGYQVSQHTTPICKGGFVCVNIGGADKKIRLNRIHLEEDAGKSLHDMDEANTCIDYNRAGTPLIEIVTEPDLRSGDEAWAYLYELRRLVRYLEVCDGNMEEGSFRCDANISVRRLGDEKLGTKVEVKNLNSMRNVKRAIEAESVRLVQVLESGGHVIQETRSYDAMSGNTFAMREKEEADDYRYFPEPDLAPFHLTDEMIEKVQRTIPLLPEERVRKYTKDLGLSAYDAGLLTDERGIADYFEKAITGTTHYKAIANWIQGPVKTWMNENNLTIKEFPLLPEKLAALAVLTESDKISFSAASGKLFAELLKNPGADPGDLASQYDLLQQSDMAEILPVVENVLEKFADKVTEYKNGKKGLLALFTGEVMKQSKGKADPKMVNSLLLDKLKNK
jgi:aspartyl-tRNA(Asn)/glutamyl-tRNA(Gln) amidotransferase subunit B